MQIVPASELQQSKAVASKQKNAPTDFCTAGALLDLLQLLQDLLSAGARHVVTTGLPGLPESITSDL